MQNASQPAMHDERRNGSCPVLSDQALSEF